ncbi:MAG: metallophosphoesterase [Rhodothermales bacterium]|nr:metallophosphoesterase [Rhodothermales bacterium]
MASTPTYLFFALIGFLVAIDIYSYRRFVRFAKHRRRLRKYVVPAYGFGVLIVPVLLLCAAYPPWRSASETISSIMFAIGVVYYIPKVATFLVLAVKDIFAFVAWLFGWFQGHLLHDGMMPTGSDETSIPQQDQTARPLDLSDMKQLKRREFVQQMGMSAASAPLVMVGYGVFKKLYDFDVRQIEVAIPDLETSLEGLRIVQLSDLHAGSMFSERPMLEAVDLVNSLSPDLVAITGDFVNEQSEEIELILPALRRLEASLGVYGCLGNHDHLGDVTVLEKRLRTTTVDILNNEHREVSFNGTKLHIAGTDNTGHGQSFGDLKRALQDIPETEHDVFHLLLAHDPRYWDTTARPDAPHINLTLSGHTHGGQFGIERGRVRLGWARLAYQRWAGLYTEFDESKNMYQHLYVNRGLGHSGAPLRLGIRPEITTLTLKRAVPEIRTARSSGQSGTGSLREARLRYIERVRSFSTVS